MEQEDEVEEEEAAMEQVQATADEAGRLGSARRHALANDWSSERRIAVSIERNSTEHHPKVESAETRKQEIR